MFPWSKRSTTFFPISSKKNIPPNHVFFYLTKQVSRTAAKFQHFFSTAFEINENILNFQQLSLKFCRYSNCFESNPFLSYFYSNILMLIRSSIGVDFVFLPQFIQTKIKTVKHVLKVS